MGKDDPEVEADAGGEEEKDVKTTVAKKALGERVNYGPKVKEGE